MPPWKLRSISRLATSQNPSQPTDMAEQGKKGQVVLITGALGSVGRAAVHTAKKIGAQVIAGVRGKDLDDARSLGVSDVLAIDDDKAIEKFRLVDAIADTVGGDVAAKLIAKVRQSGSFRYSSVLPESAAAQNPTLKITRVRAQPDPSKVREKSLRDGRFTGALPPHRFPPRSPGAAIGAGWPPPSLGEGLSIAKKQTENYQSRCRILKWDNSGVESWPGQIPIQKKSFHKE